MVKELIPTLRSRSQPSIFDGVPCQPLTTVQQEEVHSLFREFYMKNSETVKYDHSLYVERKDPNKRLYRGQWIDMLVDNVRKHNGGTCINFGYNDRNFLLAHGVPAVVIWVLQYGQLGNDGFFAENSVGHMLTAYKVGENAYISDLSANVVPAVGCMPYFPNRKVLCRAPFAEHLAKYYKYWDCFVVNDNRGCIPLENFREHEAVAGRALAMGDVIAHSEPFLDPTAAKRKLIAGKHPGKIQKDHFGSR